MAHPLRLDALAAKIEGTYGSDSTPAAATDAIRLSNRLWPGFRPSWAWRNEREDAATGTLVTAAPAPPVGHMCEFTVPVEIRGAGAAYGASSLPEADPFLQSLFARTDNFPTDVSYSTASSAHKSFTAYCWVSGPDGTKNHLYKVVGCRAASMRIPLTPGLLGTMEFVCRGLITAAISEVAIPAPTYSAVVPPSVKGVAITIGGSWTPNWETAELMVETNLQQMQSGNAADGIREFAPSGPYSMLFRITAEAVALATYNPYTVVSLNTGQALAGTLGDTQYNRMDIVGANMYLRDDPEPANFNNFAAWQLEGDIKELTLRFD